MVRTGGLAFTVIRKNRENDGNLYVWQNENMMVRMRQFPLRDSPQKFHPIRVGGTGHEVKRMFDPYKASIKEMIYKQGTYEIAYSIPIYSK